MRKAAKECLLIGASLGGLLLAMFTFTTGEAQAQALPPGQVFRDCADICPEMVVLPSGSFMMGSPVGERDDNERPPRGVTERFELTFAEMYAVAEGDENEGPQREVTFAKNFAVGRFEVTFAEWDACVNARGCTPSSVFDDEGVRQDGGWGRGRQPVMYVYWNDAQDYVRWLSSTTGQRYRLLSEAEWEYAARAGTTTRYSTGDSITAGDANFGDNAGRSVPVGSFAPNAFGLYDMHGNVWEWVQDCWNNTYSGGPVDGSAWTQGFCSSAQVFRGGSWYYSSDGIRSASRLKIGKGSRQIGGGFRVARTL